MSIRISNPDETLRDAFLRMLDDYDARDALNSERFSSARSDFSAYVTGLRDEERGLGLEDGFVPCSHRWLLDEQGELVAIVRVRHSLDHPFLAEQGGHIGYDVPPSSRGRGHGSAALRAGLARAHELGLTRVLVCASANNSASCAVIESCGGLLERELHSDHFGCVVRRYWIELLPTASSGEPA